MSETEPAAPGADPSMEDILASIRRILDDGGTEGDDATAQAARRDRPVESSASSPFHATGSNEAGPPAETVASSRSAEPSAARGSDDVFLLDQSMLIEEPVAMQPDTASPPSESAAPPTPPHALANLDSGQHGAEPLLAASTAAATNASLGALARAVSQRQTQLYRGGPTLEDMVREELRPLVKAWLDENLAAMVEALVRAEIERVTGKR